eukprot:gene4088-5116_t
MEPMIIHRKKNQNGTVQTSTEWISTSEEASVSSPILISKSITTTTPSTESVSQGGGGANTAPSTTTTITTAPRKNGDYTIFKTIRFLSILLWVFTFTIIVWISVPLTIIFIDPFLKKLKVRKYYFPLEILSRAWARGIIWLLNVEVKLEGADLLRACECKPTVMMYTHASYLDPVVMQGYSPIPSKFIFKKELLFLLPVVFILAYLVGHIPINRKKKQAAIDSINEAASSIIKYNRCVSISPEGTRSKDGELQPFKKGPFHLAINTKAMIAPVCVYGAYDLWPSKNFFPNSGTIVARFLPPFEIPKESTVDSLLDLTRHKIEEAVSKPPANFNPFPTKPSISHSLFFIFGMTTLFYLVLKYLL